MSTPFTLFFLFPNCIPQYPAFLQLNKQARVQISQPLSPDLSTPYQLFATANSKEWFVAVIAGSSSSSGIIAPFSTFELNLQNGLELIFSPLEHLRSAFNAAKEDDRDLFTPKRSLPLAFGKVNIVTFAYHDTRLLVGLERGAVAIYDTAALFTPGSGDIQPLRVTQLQSGPLRQIVPNPGTEQNLSNLVAVVGAGKAVLLDMQLEPQGGWTASDSLTQPVAGLFAYCPDFHFDLLSYY
jgi:nucleoporin NUP159